MLPLMILLVQTLGAATSSPAKSMTVCDVLAKDPARLNGQTISVTGILTVSDEGTWLIDKCETHLTTEGLTWGDGLSVYVDGLDEDIAHSWEKIDDKLRRLHADVRRDRIRLTILGRLETRKSLDDAVIQMPYGLSRAGFGHLSSAPAEINVISVQDVKVERLPRRTKH
jgi:hypothetical protein